MPSSRSLIALSDAAAPHFVALYRFAVNWRHSRTMTGSSRQAYWRSACHDGAGIRKRPNCARFWRDSTMGRPVARTRENPDSNNCRSADPGQVMQRTGVFSMLAQEVVQHQGQVLFQPVQADGPEWDVHVVVRAFQVELGGAAAQRGGAARR